MNYAGRVGIYMNKVLLQIKYAFVYKIIVKIHGSLISRVVNLKGESEIIGVDM